jgi:hypothetical protein
MQKGVEVGARIDGGQRFVHDGESRSLRGHETAATNQDCNESHDLGEIHTGWFDFTLGTA